MKTLFVAFSHSLTPDQKEGWDGIFTLNAQNPELQKRFSQVDPEAETFTCVGMAMEIVGIAIQCKATHIMCVGEWTIAANVANFAKQHGIIPVTSTTVRDAVEEVQEDGSIKIVHKFKHVRWRPMFI